MKGLAIDCAVSKLTIAAKNDDKVFISIYDIGMKQSETIVPGIDLAIQKAGLDKSELEYLALTVGPGSFTGLRLAISALKALEMAFNIPLYGISSLEAYGYSFKDMGLPVISCIDANKDKFYTRIFDEDKILLEDGDYEIQIIAAKLKKIKKAVICGPDAEKLAELIKANNKKIELLRTKFQPNGVEALFAITEAKITAGEAPLKDFDGPVYLRASEAEIKLNQ